MNETDTADNGLAESPDWVDGISPDVALHSVLELLDQLRKVVAQSTCNHT